MGYEYLIFGGTLLFACLLGTGAGLVHNKTSKTYSGDFLMTLPVIPTERKKNFKFEEPKSTSKTWTAPTNPEQPPSIADNVSIAYTEGSIGEHWGAALIEPTKKEWFVSNEKKLKKSTSDSPFLTQGLKEVWKKLQGKQEEPDGSLLQKWCRDHYKYELASRKNDNIVTDVWLACRTVL